MHQSLKFLRLTVTSLLFCVSSPQFVIGTTVSSLPRNSQAQRIPNPQTDRKPLYSDRIIQFNQDKLSENIYTFEQFIETYRILNNELDTSINSRIEETNNFKNLIKLDTAPKEPNKLIEISQETLRVARKSGDRNTELKVLISLGDAYNSLGNYQLAIESATASLEIAQELQNFQAKATAFVTLAGAYQSLASSKSDYQKATTAAISGLTTAWKVKDHESEAKALAILGSAYNYLGNQRNALVFAQQGLNVAKENNIPVAAVSSLLTLASVHLGQGEYQQAIESTEQSKDYLKKLQKHEAEAATLVMQGLAYYGQGSTQKSVEFTEQGLAIARNFKNPIIEALGLIVLGLNSSDAKDFQKATELINQSRIIAKEQKKHNFEALILEILGGIYRESGEKQQAIASYQEAISINNSYTAKAGLARIYQNDNLLTTAITYYKQAINTNQEQAQNWIPELPIWLQSSFPQAIKNMNNLRTVDIYRSLANLLLLQRRLPEAQQVLELLKEQELRDYTGNNTVSSQPISLTITPTEEEILKKYGSLITFGEQLDECLQTHCNQLGKLLEQRAVLTQQYYQTLEQLETALRNRSTFDKAFLKPTQFALKAQAIVEEQPNTVLIYPLVLQDKIWLLWASKGGIFKSVEVTDVSQAQLEVTILRFRQLVQNRLSNIEELKATGKQLYDWLIKPIEKELKANDIHNLVFSLDRSTRYIPISALFDGEKYLAQNYSVSTVLSANLTKTSSISSLPISDNQTSPVSPPFVCQENCQSNFEAPLANNQIPKILGVGVSDAIADFTPLPNVPAELDAIIRQNPDDDQGIYPGQKFLNKAFDFFALRDNLSGRKILHIATHSEFVPGRVYKSFLLLGTGEKLAIPDIETWLNLQGIDLVVLSACETALGGPGLDGREITGMGYYFLKGGAKTVMASLWSVDDLSTRLLMEQFYKNLAKGTFTSPVTKAEALRQAQLALLNGNYTMPSVVPQEQSTADPRSQFVEQQSESSPSITQKNTFSHPYYWASFILMGSGGWQVGGMGK